jgi:hypothetical protein
MADFSSGVKSYIYGECTIKVHFPIDWHDNADISCYQCKMFSRNTGVCQLTKEVSEYPTKHRGSECPLVFDGEIIELKGEKRNESN